MYNILVYDYINKCYLIYDTEPVDEDQLCNIVDLILYNIKESMPNEELHVSYTTEKECDVYIYKENLNKGWVWNSIVPEKKLLFQLQTVAYLPSQELKEFKKFTDASSQSEPNLQKKDAECEALIEMNYNCKCNYKQKNDTYIIDDIPLELNNFGNSSTLSNSSVSSNSTQESTLSSSSVIKKIVNEVSTIKDEFVNDMRHSIEWGKSFHKELQDRLNLENYGLYKYKKE